MVANPTPLHEASQDSDCAGAFRPLGNAWHQRLHLLPAHRSAPAHNIGLVFAWPVAPLWLKRWGECVA